MTIMNNFVMVSSQYVCRNNEFNFKALFLSIKFYHFIIVNVRIILTC